MESLKSQYANRKRSENISQFDSYLLRMERARSVNQFSFANNKLSVSAQIDKKD